MQISATTMNPTSAVEVPKANESKQVEKTTSKFEKILNEDNVSKLLKPEDISYEEYKTLSDKDLAKLFPLERDSNGDLILTNEVRRNETDYHKALSLRRTSYKLEDDTLGKVLFDRIKNSDLTNESEQLIHFDISHNINRPTYEALQHVDMRPDFLYALDKKREEGGELGDYVLEYHQMNPDYLDKQEKISEELQKKRHKLIDENRVSAEDFFKMAQEELDILKTIIEKRENGTLEEPEASKPPSKRELHYEELLQAHKEIKLEYQNRITLQNSVYDTTSRNIQKAIFEQHD